MESKSALISFLVLLVALIFMATVQSKPTQNLGRGESIEVEVGGVREGRQYGYGGYPYGGGIGASNANAVASSSSLGVGGGFPGGFGTGNSFAAAQASSNGLGIGKK